MKNGRPEVVVVTGASAGVGRATVREFARRGAHLGLVARGWEGLEAARHEVEELGGKALVIPADVADANQIEAAAERTEERFGPIDIWVNDAMATVFARFKDLDPAEFRRVTEVTYLGCVYGTMAALRRMLTRNRGCIVQVGSALAYRSIPLQSAYCGAKHAIRGFTDSIRSELLHDGSRVHLTMVQLPAVNTPQFQWGKNEMPHKPKPVGTIYQPEVPARAIYWAAHHRRREVYVGISAVKAIVGNKVIPGALDHFLAQAAFHGQQRNEPRDPNHRDNLWEPVPGDYGAHGPFDQEARSFCPQLWLVENRSWLGAVAAGLGGVVFGSCFKRRRLLAAH